ncbi:MAG: hypothetical protein OXF47_11665 [Nitrospira sp.]|nr:hypothetical protein [Nitrospira sp.]
MIYAVVPLEEDTDLGEAIKQIDTKAYVDHAPHIYFVSYEGSSAELAKSLGFTSKNEPPIVGIVLRVGPYHGYASGELWEWLLTHQPQTQ